MRAGFGFWRGLYRRLASAYPHEFRMLYGQDLDRLGEDAIPEVSRRYGIPGLLRLIADIAMRLPSTYGAEIRQDVVYAARMLAKSPGFTAIAVLSIAIGIGMCSAEMSEARSLVGAPPGVRDAKALFAALDGVSYPYYQRYREERPAVDSAMVYLGPVPLAVAFTAEKTAKAERFFGHLVSPDYFTTLGVTPAAGRLFDPATEKPGMPPVVVVSERFWRTHLGADPQAVGRTLRVNGRNATIVGIGPKGFLGFWPVNPADLFIPVTSAPTLAPELNGDPLHEADRAVFRIVFRLPHGEAVATAEGALDAATHLLDRENGLAVTRERKGKPVQLIPGGTIVWMTPLQHEFIDTFTFFLWGMVLTLVCANLANLLLARGAARGREIAVRLSVGASRARLIRQFLTESLLLSLAGAVASIALAYVFTDIMASLPVPSPTPLEYQCRLDWSVLAAALAIALAAGVGFGLAPALASAHVDIGGALKEGAQAPLRGYRRFGLRNLFVVCQMAASLMLLLVTWYVVLMFLDNSRLDPGFETAHLNLISLDPVRDGYSPASAASLFTALPDELAPVNGVREVALTGAAPLASMNADSPNTQVSAPSDDPGPRAQHAVFREHVGANYFATVGMPILAGREFDRRDGRYGETAIVNQSAARDLFGAADPIGRRIVEGKSTYAVVGVTRDVQSGFLVTKPVPTLFLPCKSETRRSRAWA